MIPNRAVFLDRDGTINEEVNYLHRIEDFRLIPGAPQAIKILKEAGFFVVVVTNQSGVARGYFDMAAVQAIHRHLDAELAKIGTSVDAYYICPHHPEHGVGEYRKDCVCRKPLPGMLMEAAENLSIDLSRSFMVGDKRADFEAGSQAGCTALMVRTGYGIAESSGMEQNVVFDDLMAAAEAIVAKVKPESVTP